VIIRPLGDTVVLMPPLAISKADLARLVDVTADSIRAAYASAYGREEPVELRAAA
jgi:adenosylmethionine-8-amino-7-oxononanoate aminotransferase